MAEEKQFIDKVKEAFDFVIGQLKKITGINFLKQIRGLVGAAAGYAALWGLRASIMAHPEAAFRILNFITKYYYTPPQVWAGFINEYMKQMTGKEIDMDAFVKLGARVGGRSVMEVFGEEFMTPMLNLILPRPPLTFDKGMDAAERFLGVNLTFQMNAWLLHLIGDIVSLGKMKSLKDLPNAISWSFGIGWLSWLVMGTPFRKAISEPLEKGFNKIYTPELLAKSEALRAWIAEKITTKELQEELLQHGLSPEKIAVLAELAERELSDSDLKKLYFERVITEKDIEEELKLRGYGKWRRKYLIQLITKDRILKWRDKVLDAAMDVFIEGQMTKTDFEGYLDVLKYNEQEKKLIIDFCMLEKIKKSTPTVAQIKQAFKKNYISYREAKSMLLDKGWDDRWADIILEAME